MNNTKPVTINAADYKQEIREVFALNDPRYQLEITVNRGVMEIGILNDRKATCAIYVRFVASEKDDKAPAMRASHWWCADANDANVHLVMTHTGCRFTVDHFEVDNIISAERDRLHALFSELRGVRYTFVQNMFGFLEKDGSDKEQIVELPFPMIAAEPKSRTETDRPT
ncbi:hypothetical protein [Janthinobacterium sp. MDT1-19]|uniref:hypothetical protein n=1 Tax=Janthinobacterium sp. MDT1-19 TaxID=1259339 RepID=UPI003F204C18